VLAEETGTITVKGFSKPVRTYRVVGVHDRDGSQARILRQEQEGLLLVIDQKKLSTEGRAEVARLLEDAAAKLRR
jgi:hypothetical protein